VRSYKSHHSSGSSGGLGFTSVLTLIFITLKLLGLIDWSWWWVLSPLWISAAIVIPIVLIIIVAGVIVTIMEK